MKETFQGKTVWDRIVEVFDLIGHDRASRVYAWAHDTDNPKKPRRHVRVLPMHPVTSAAAAAVRAAVVQEFRSLEPAEEN